MRERVYYVVDLDTGFNLYKRLALDEAQQECRKMNAKEDRLRFKPRGGWVLHKA